MDKEELKQKIVKVLKETINWTTDYSIPIGIVYKSELDEIADALIAAGYGDVKEAEHRAAGAEKELLVYKEVAGAMLCEIGCSNEGYCPEFYKDPECKNCTKKKIYGNFAATSPCLLDKYIQQAEKELAEERKDD